LVKLAGSGGRSSAAAKEEDMKTKLLSRGVAALLVVIATASLAPVAGAQELVIATRDSSPLSLRDCSVQPTELRCRVVNHSSAELRDIQLAIRRDYQWAREFHPGDVSPGWSAIVDLPEPIPPGGSLTFRYPGPFGETGGDGRFRTSVEVLRYTELTYPGRS
jgi:hypothetical protein